MAKRTREIKGVSRRYAWRLYPTPEQEEVLRRQGIMCSQLWNALLEMCERRAQRGVQRYGKSVSFHCAECAHRSAAGKIVLCDEHKLPHEYEMDKWVSAMLAECPEWREMSTYTPRRVSFSLAAAFQAFFRRAKVGAGLASGYPRFKRPGTSIPHRCKSGCKLRKSDRHSRSWEVYLKGVPGLIWARGRLPEDAISPNEWTDTDVRLVDGRWEISAAMSLDERRHGLPFAVPTVVRFNLIDGFALVNNEPFTPADFAHVQRLEERQRAMQSEFDQQWPRGKRLSDEQFAERAEMRAEISRLSNRARRVRANALHVWSKRVVERASMITIIKPPMQARTRSPRGDEAEWGANIKTVSAINRTALSFAPGMAAQMLEYKAKEIGIPLQIIEDEMPDIAIGEKLVAAGKTVRRTKRALKEMER